MKKQILFLAMFTLALIFAGSNNVLGQAVYKNYIEGTPVCPEAIPLTCAGAVTGAPELSPVAGAPYTYTIAALPATVSSVLWFVTNDLNVIHPTTNLLTTTRDPGDGTGTYLATSGPANVYNNNTATPNTSMSVNLSWKNFDGNINTVLLVAYVKGAAGCTDNIEVWRIKPVFTFTLDVLSMNDDGSLGSTAVPASECVSPVQSAVYTPGTTDYLTMNYGKNYVFFNVTAANFVGSWKPLIAATATTGTIGTVEWAYPSQATLNAASQATGIWNPATSIVKKQNVVANDSVVGPLANAQCIIVRVEVINNAIEAPINTAVNAITLTVDGTMRDAGTNSYAVAALKDVDEPATAGGACRNDYLDTATFNITARPDINEVAPTTLLGPFVPKN